MGLATLRAGDPVGRPVRERLGVTLQQRARPARFAFEIQRVPFAGYSARPSIGTAHRIVCNTPVAELEVMPEALAGC